MEDIFGCEFRVPGEGRENVDVLCTEIEGGNTIGISLTESKGITMRRIAIELQDRAQIELLRDVLSAHLAREKPAGGHGQQTG